MSWFWDFLLVVFRSLKLIVRWLLGTHEIERILGRKFSKEMPYLLENYINKSLQLKSISAAIKSPSLDINKMYLDIICLKKLNKSSNFHQQYIKPNIMQSLKMIKSYNEILKTINEESIIKFNNKDNEHQTMLFKLWSIMKPITLHKSLINPIQQIEFQYNNNINYKPSLIDSAWEFIGFQSEKPWTDFRGVGLFGLKQLIYFGKYYNNFSNNILLYCMQNGQQICYSYAITGINITYDVMTLYRKRGKMNKFYYKYIYDDKDNNNNNINAVHLLYCKAYVEFYKTWKQNPPKTVMGYKDVHDKYLKKMEIDLQNDNFRLLSS